MFSTIPEAAVWAIFFLPLASVATIALITYNRPRISGYVTVATIAASFVLSLWVLDSVIQNDGHPLDFSSHLWVAVGDLEIFLGLGVDGLTAIMLLAVTGVSLLVQFYSQGYMAGDSGYSRYFAYMSLFTASMLGLVLADNLLMLFVFWELVGLCSYLLIGFWFHRPPAARAAVKAFITTRLGDLGLVIALVLIWRETGTFNFIELKELALVGAIGSTVLTWFAVAVFTGAMGKSAQFPLHVWLPDAMEGPTPVSALIHAATMVAAGVYLVARLFPIFSVSDEAMLTVATIGGITAGIAATMGLVMTDIKRVLAYSTISQLGYMIMALGLGGYVAAVFHLFNHAFFKALLFLGSGSVNHATNTFDMRKMGGLARVMPYTFATFVIASLSLAGVFPFSGFWSKDEILLDGWRHGRVFFAVGLGVAFLTSLYMFRAIFMTFGGHYRGGEPGEPAHQGAGDGHHSGPHESPWIMVLPLVVLVVPSVITGFLSFGGWFAELVNGALPGELAAEHHFELFPEPWIPIVSVIVAIAGIGVAWAVYGLRIIESEAIQRALAPAHRLVENKYYMDYLYEDLLLKGVFYRGVTFVVNLFDSRVVDGVVNGLATGSRLAGRQLRLLHGGQLQGYAVVTFFGILAILAGVLIVNP